MLFIKYLLTWGGAAMMAIAVGMLGYDFYLLALFRKAQASGATPPEYRPVRWRAAVALALLAWAPLLIATGIIVVPSGMGGVRVSQTRGTLAGTLYPGTHFVTPLAERVQWFDTRDQLFTTGAMETAEKSGTAKSEPLKVQSKEGLDIGLAITVRYRLDARHLDYIQANLPQPVEKEIVPAVVASAWRELVPNFTVREVFATQREPIRKKASDVITQKLAADGIIVKEVMLRDIQLPHTLRASIETKQQAEQESLAMGFRLQKERQEADRKRIEAQGIHDFQQIVAQGISPQLLQWKGIEATETLAKSSNTKIVVIGNTKNGLPLVMGQ